MTWESFLEISDCILKITEKYGMRYIVINRINITFYNTFILFFYFTILYWFCCTSTWICHRYTRVPHPETPPTSLPIPSLWVVPVHHPQASSVMHRTWTGDSFHLWHYTCFSAILPNHPTPSLSLSLRVQKSTLHICVFFAASQTGSSLPSF